MKYAEIKTYSRKLRRGQTDVERRLWYRIRTHAGDDTALPIPRGSSLRVIPIPPAPFPNFREGGAARLAMTLGDVKRLSALCAGGWETDV